MDFGVLVGKTLTNVENRDDEEIVFTADDGSEFKLYHWQSCCENVTVEDIVGDLTDLIGSPILQAEEVSSEVNEDVPECHSDSYTWTFYKLATMKGRVTLRWLGESNGYYSESVDFDQTAKAH